MADYENLCSDPSIWKQKLLQAHFPATNFEKTELHNRNNRQGKKHGLEELVQLREVEAGCEKNKVEFVLKEV